MVDYTTRFDNGVEIAEVIEDTVRYEFPLNNNLSAEEKQIEVNNTVEKLKLNNFLQNFDLMVSYKDNVYMNGELVRTDTNVMSNDSFYLIEELINSFPQYTIEDIQSNPNNIIGTYGNYRPPYNNNSISVYYFEEPSSTILNSYGCINKYTGILRSWYGLKHDLVTKEISAKIVFAPEDYKLFFNNFPTIEDTNNVFFACIHNLDGTVSDWVDMYVFKTNTQMKEYCQSIGKPFPLPDNINQQCWIYSIVFNKETGEINNVKGYIRQNA